MANIMPPGGRPQSMKDESLGPPNQSGLDPKLSLSTFIYDFFLKRGKVELAQAILNSDLGVKTRPRQKKSPNNTVNGMDDSMDLEKDEIAKRVESLPEADIVESLPKDSFLEDWWALFWDIWSASKQRKGSPSAQQFMQQQAQNRMQSRMIQQQHIANRNMAQNMNRMGPADMQRAAANNQRFTQMRANMAGLTPQQQASLQQGEMTGQQRPQSPMSGDAPSPKRARVDGPPFGNNQMNPNMAAPNRPGGAQMPNGPGQQPGMGMPNGLEMPNGAFGMAGNPQNRMPQFSGMNQKFPGMPKEFNGSNAEMNSFDDMSIFPENIRNGNMNGGAPGTNQGGALADYQMQLMLLEQQNKKRLLMARQEQEVTSQGGGPPGATQGATMMGAGPGAPFQPGMSPNRRNGQSPSPNDPSKRAGSGGFESGPMGAQGMNQQFFNTPMGGPNGMRGPGPNFPAQGAPMGMEPQIQRARAMGAPQGWPGPQGMQPGGMPGMQQGPGNPQQNPMPPPSAPNPGPNAGRTNPSSPAPGANPPTPQQQTKNAPANKNTKKETAKDNKKSKPAAKKGANNQGAAPNPEAENNNGPPTPTPATPITPSAPNNPFGKGAPGQNVNGQNNGPQPSQPQPQNMPGHPPDVNGVNPANPFGSLAADMENDFGGLDFANVGGEANDVLEGFDFDSFLNTGADDNTFGGDFGFNMGGDGNEMGIRDV